MEAATSWVKKKHYWEKKPNDCDHAKDTSKRRSGRSGGATSTNTKNWGRKTCPACHLGENRAVIIKTGPDHNRARPEEDHCSVHTRELEDKSGLWEGGRSAVSHVSRGGGEVGKRFGTRFLCAVTTGRGVFRVTTVQGASPHCHEGKRGDYNSKG